MLQDRTLVKIADNSGGIIGRVFKILGGSKRRYAGVGDEIVISIQTAQPRKSVKKKEVHRAVVVRTTNAVRRKDGSYVRFDENAVVLIVGSGKEPKEPKEPKEARERPASTPKQVAEIQLGTSPYAETTIDGRKYGSTPFFGPRKLNLPVGTHKIEFFDKQNNKRYRYQIKLKAPDPNNKVVIQFNKTDPPKVEGQVELKKLD